YPEVSRAVKAGIPVERLFICPDIFSPESKEFEHLATDFVTREVFAAMAFGSRLKGILALCRPVERRLADLRPQADGLIVVLEAVEKPGNLGAVLRTADGAGVAAVIMCDGKTDVYNQHVVRSSIGTVFTVPIVAAGKEDILAYLRERGFSIFVASARADRDYTMVDMRGRTAIVVGNEHAGVSPFWVEQCDQNIRIPMQGAASSLNVTVSASILIYEGHRQKMLLK
ncbi:MAG: RNA methyltransferase, partial [Candidatus Omnitrophica bacterium]|nr:RNA methyltransferase [Candidatus Omnitrophota bacterium]